MDDLNSTSLSCSSIKCILSLHQSFQQYSMQAFCRQVAVCFSVVHISFRVTPPALGNQMIAPAPPHSTKNMGKTSHDFIKRWWHSRTWSTITLYPKIYDDDNYRIWIRLGIHNRTLLTSTCGELWGVFSDCFEIKIKIKTSSDIVVKLYNSQQNKPPPNPMNIRLPSSWT